jgi:hypothetical protein
MAEEVKTKKRNAAKIMSRNQQSDVQLWIFFTFSLAAQCELFTRVRRFFLFTPKKFVRSRAAVD